MKAFVFNLASISGGYFFLLRSVAADIRSFQHELGRISSGQQAPCSMIRLITDVAVCDDLWRPLAINRPTEGPSMTFPVPRRSHRLLNIEYKNIWDEIKGNEEFGDQSLGLSLCVCVCVCVCLCVCVCV